MDWILMEAWLLSPLPNVPGNTADSGLRCLGNEITVSVCGQLMEHILAQFS